MNYNNSVNVPIKKNRNAPLGLLGQQYHRKRKYRKSTDVEELAMEKYKQTGKGITFADLLNKGLVKRKSHAQNTLKRCLQRGVLFTLENHKPQQYYPSCFRSEILKKIMLKNAPIQHTVVTSNNTNNTNYTYPWRKGKNELIDKEIRNLYLDSLVIKTLEGYVLPLLPEAPLYIHKLFLKLTISSQYYQELRLIPSKRNKGKEHEEIIGSKHIKYRFSPNGTIMVYVECSNFPFKIENIDDYLTLIAFLGQVKDRLVTFLMDKYERIVPDIMEWYLIQCDINKDIPIDHQLNFTSIKAQIKHWNHVFRIYIKLQGNDTICRVEKSITPNKPIVTFIEELFKFKK
jgi:hypothetical protein